MQAIKEFSLIIKHLKSYLMKLVTIVKRKITVLDVISSMFSKKQLKNRRKNSKSQQSDQSKFHKKSDLNFDLIKHQTFKHFHHKH